MEVESNGTITSPLTDPMGGASTGSMWPAFANEWFTQTGRKAAFIDAATGGTSLLPDATGNWSPNGANRTSAKNLGYTAWSAVFNNPSYALGDTYIIWHQGETDAETINGTTITRAEYQDGLDNLITDLAGTIPHVKKFAALSLGTKATAGGDVLDISGTSLISDYQDIRNASYDAVTANAKSEMIYEGTASYPSLGYMGDSVHYNQTALNEAGKCAARRLAGASTAPTVTSPYLSTTSYVDTADSDKTSRTESHTNGADTTCLIVTAVASTYSATSAFTLSATFNGVTMNTSGIATSTGTGELAVYQFYLNDDTYGGTLASATGDIVVTASGSVNALHFAAIEAKDAYRVDAMAGNADVTSTTTASHVIEPILDSLVVTVSGANINSGTGTTATLTNLTKTVDSNIERTKSVQIAVGYTTVDAGDATTLGTIFGATAQEITIVSCAYRGRISGEA